MPKSERQRIINHLKQLDQNEFDRFLDDVREARGFEAAGVEALGRMFAAREARSRSTLAGIFGSKEQGVIDDD